MSIEWNKVTWYSKILAVVLFVATFYIGYHLGQEKKGTPNPNTYPTPTKTESKTPRVSIKEEEDIKEENFSGTKAVVSGVSPLVALANKNINSTISEFKARADEEVPGMRKEFGADNPTANYTIDVSAAYIKSSKTESIVLEIYTYTGGAHGSSYYNVFTSSLAHGNILTIGEVIEKDEQAKFTEFVKKQLNVWAPSGSTAPVVFPDTVKDLKLADFANWSFDADHKNLIIYFDQYAVGPGVLGAMPFPLSIQKIEGFLNTDFK